ncbi:VSP [Giardia lamblia P15]|uniref:VSP n=1 Tax=Giardia intestinalis (strain P15) TaxID=658858 RepID=E1F3H3_GIAIA|nr:VSP [Giardia lamblia P15]
MLLIAFYLLLSVLAAACSGSAQTNCVENECTQVGATVICTQCQTGFVPINGDCKSKTDSATNCKKADDSEADQICGKCMGANFFLYKGGCYEKAKAPGNIICSDEASGGTDGICTSCNTANGFFPNLAPAASTKQSCIACNETANINGLTGVSGCVACTNIGPAGQTDPKPATCTKCESTTLKYLKTVDGVTTCVTENDCDKDNQKKFFIVDNAREGGKCISCGNKDGAADASNGIWKGVEGCVKCTKSVAAGSATCTECAVDLYLKTDSGATSCVNEAVCKESNTHFPTTNSDKKICVTCDTTANGGIDDCEKCTLKTVSIKTSPIITCSKCKNRWLSPLGDACLEKCPAGTYSERGTDNVGVCAPCHNTCAECDGNAEATSCRACYPGFVLSYGSDKLKGTCIQECTGKYAENCEANQCTAVVGGSKYCSKCKTGYVPVDGICVSATARAIEGCNPGNDGTCTTCKEAYFKESGGCYRSTAFPGNELCSVASDGKCTTCANGQTADKTSGSCPACDSTCKTCTEANKPDKCSTCPPGRYFDSTAKACKLCTEDSNDGKIKGVENCLSCKEPANSPGTVICYVKKDGTSGGGGDSGSGGGSTNKSGLSTGAIAGIAVAAIVVVGGLVGFLCWWFICRGKA